MTPPGAPGEYIVVARWRGILTFPKPKALRFADISVKLARTCYRELTRLSRDNLVPSFVSEFHCLLVCILSFDNLKLGS